MSYWIKDFSNNLCLLLLIPSSLGLIHTLFLWRILSCEWFRPMCMDSYHFNYIHYHVDPGA